MAEMNTRTRRTPPGSPAGFTLIELLVVISIVVLLISILLPALRSAMEAARFVKCGSNQRQIALANALYADDYDGMYTLNASDPRQWYNVLRPYTNHGARRAGVAATGGIVEAFICPSDPTEGGRYDRGAFPGGLTAANIWSARSYNISRNVQARSVVDVTPQTMVTTDHDWWQISTRLIRPQSPWLESISTDRHRKNLVQVSYIDTHVEAAERGLIVEAAVQFMADHTGKWPFWGSFPDYN